MSNQEQKDQLPNLEFYENINDLPIKDQQRTCTDVCCIILGLAFTLVLIILAAAIFNYQTFLKSSFPTDSDGKLCGAQLTAYPYVYFANPPQIGRRVCVSECPKEGDKQLKCYTTNDVGCRFSSTPGFEVSYYENTQQVDKLGRFCFPTDEKMKDQLLTNANLKQKYILINSIEVVSSCCLFSLGLSVLFVILTQCLPKFINFIAVYGGIILFLALIICFFIYDSVPSAKIPLGIILLVLFAILVLNLIKNRKMFSMYGIFLQSSTKMLKSDKCCAFMYIPIFLVMTFLFFLILIFELKSYLGGGSIQFHKDESIFWEFADSNRFLIFLLAVQAIWGLAFLKQAFNFCVSGNAVSWYYDAEWSCQYPFQTLVTKHFGSIIAGSFMTGFLTLVDYFFDLIKPSSKDDQSCYGRCFHFTCKCCLSFTDLVRSDTMTYINIAGIPYCNASRYCEYLVDKSLLMEGSQSASRTYRICAHFLIASAVGIFGLYLKGTIAPVTVFVIVGLSLFISTYFISIHADAAEAMIILFLNNEEVEMRKILEDDTEKGHRKDIKNFSKIKWRKDELKDQIQKLREMERNQQQE